MHAATLAMTPPAANTPPTILRDDLSLLPGELAHGHGALAIFRARRGLCWVQALGPHGLPGDSSDFLVAPRPVVELWVSEHGDGPLSTARPGRGFAGALDTIESTALAWLLPQEQAPLHALLAAFRAAWPAPGRLAIPKVGPGVETSGQPCITAWSSALSMADLEQVLRRAVA